MALYALNQAAVDHARALIEGKQYVLESDWGVVRPEFIHEADEGPTIGHVSHGSAPCVAPPDLTGARSGPPSGVAHVLSLDPWGNILLIIVDGDFVIDHGSMSRRMTVPLARASFSTCRSRWCPTGGRMVKPKLAGRGRR
jgi:hypothetical protein